MGALGAQGDTQALPGNPIPQWTVRLPEGAGSQATERGELSLPATTRLGPTSICPQGSRSRQDGLGPASVSLPGALGQRQVRDTGPPRSRTVSPCVEGCLLQAQQGLRSWGVEGGVLRAQGPEQQCRQHTSQLCHSFTSPKAMI